MAKVSAIASPMDLDAVASVYLLRRAIKDEIEVKYLDHSVIDKSEADYILDSPHGVARIRRFDHHDTKEFTCAAMKVVEYYNMGYAERRLADAVCWQDNAGWRSLDRNGMDNLLDSMLKSFMVSGLSQVKIDDLFKTIFDAMITKFQEDYKALADISKNIVFKSPENEVFAVRGDFPKDLLFQEYSPILLVKASKWGISVTRSAKRKKPDLNDFKHCLSKLVEGGIDKWFFHPQGFYFGYSMDPESPEPIPIETKKLSEELKRFLDETEEV